MIVLALQKAILQLPERGFRLVLFKAVSITIATLAMFVVALGYGVSSLGDVSLPVLGDISFGATAGWIAAIAAVFLSGFLMLPVATVVIGFFLEDVASQVEARYYPDLVPPRVPRLSNVLGEGLRFMGIIVGANLLAILAYIVFAPFAPLIFYGMNGFLLGREYFYLVALRRCDPVEARRMWVRHRRSIWGLGILLALPLSVPFLGLLIPLVGVAAFTHVFQHLEMQDGG